MNKRKLEFNSVEYGFLIIEFSTGDQFQICKLAGITTYSAPMPTTSPSYDCIPTVEFSYDKDNDHYVCPSGDILRKVGHFTSRNNYKAFMYKTPACKTCLIRQERTKNKSGLVIERTEYQDAIDENKQRVSANRNYYYKLRQQIIEHQFGVLKRQWGFSYTLIRGKVNVLSEVNLMMVAYNLHRFISIMGWDKVKKRLSSLISSFVNVFLTTLEINWCSFFADVNGIYIRTTESKLPFQA